MTGSPATPTLADWAAAVMRGLRPARWLLCAAGLTLSVLLAAEAQAWLEQQPPRLSGWWERPAEEAQALWAAVSGLSLVGATACVGAFLAITGAGWCLVGAWIARDELLTRREGGTRPGAPLPGPTALVFERGKALLQCCPLPLLVALPPLALVLFAGWVNAWLGGFGAVLVSVCLPVVLLASLILLVLALGAIAWPLMPLTLAAERSDCFDALSRSYNYALQRPFRWLFLTVATLVLAGLPLAALRYPLAETLAGLSPEGQQTVTWLVGAVSVSIYWSLQTLVYLDLRTLIDAVDAGEVAVDPPPGRAYQPAPSNRQTPGSGPLPVAPAPEGLAALLNWASALALVVASCWLMVWLLGRAGGDVEWLAWGVGESFVPKVTGLYRLASLIAGFWGVCLVLLFLTALARRLRGSAGEGVAAPGPRLSAPNGPRPLTAPGGVRQ